LGKVSTGHHDPVSLGMLIGGAAVAVVCVVLVRRDYRLHHAPELAKTGQPIGTRWGW
jgi:hypothetical protein